MPDKYEYDEHTGLSKERYLDPKYCTPWGTPLVDLEEFKKDEIFVLTKGAHEWYVTDGIYIALKDFSWINVLKYIGKLNKTKDGYLQYRLVENALVDGGFARLIQAWKEFNVTG